MSRDHTAEPGPDLSALHRYLRRLKELPRTGWVQRGVEGPETVAAHSHAVAVLAMAEAWARGLDPGRAALLALVHDLAEAVVGDLVPGQVDEAAKRDMERTAITRIDREAGLGGLISGLWEAYEAQASPEARLVRELDRLDPVLQAEHYEAAGRAAPSALQDLVDNVRARLTDPRIIQSAGPTRTRS